MRTLKSHLEVAQSSARKHASANERLLEEADSARAERDEARSTVSTLMDESTTVRCSDFVLSFHHSHIHACVILPLIQCCFYTFVRYMGFSY